MKKRTEAVSIIWSTHRGKVKYTFRMGLSPIWLSNLANPEHSSTSRKANILFT